MAFNILAIQSAEFHKWDDYVSNQPHSTLYHLSGWANVIRKTYGHEPYYLIATKDTQSETPDSKEKRKAPSAIRNQRSANNIVGVLPLVHMKHFIFGNSLISLPFVDYGGILADDEEAEKALLLRAIKLAEELDAGRIELRQTSPLLWLNPNALMNSSDPDQALSCAVKSHKVRMLLRLPLDADTLMKSFKSKLRSQIKKPLKENCSTMVGHLELIDDFYEVFSQNMRDLGSPVHSKKLIQNVLKQFPATAKICLVKRDGQSLASSLILSFRDTIENPWASALREYSKLSPNMLLYWSMLEYACDQGFAYFDFGRSSRGEGTYKFKEQWGAEPTKLHWHYISLNGQRVDEETDEKSKLERAIKYWQKLPVPVTKIIGPMIRKHIGL